MAKAKRVNITQKMIAERVGLDRRTVSQALSGRSGLAEATRQKILDTAREMGYTPNFTARAIRTGKQQRIGLLTSTRVRFSHLPAERLQGMQSAALHHGFGFNLLRIPDQQISDYKALSEIIGGFGVDGVIFNYGRNAVDDLSPLLKQFNLPAIAVNNMLPHDCIYPDDFAIAKTTVRKMIEQGVSPLLYVSYGKRKVSQNDGGEMPLHFSENERMRGAHAAAKEAGKDIIICETDDITTDFILSLQRRKKKRIGILCYNTLSMLRIYKHLIQAGLSLPADALVTYFAMEALWDLELDSMFRPILLPEYMVGVGAVNMLVKRLTTGKKQPAVAVTAPEQMYDFALGQQPYYEFDWKSLHPSFE